VPARVGPIDDEGHPIRRAAAEGISDILRQRHAATDNPRDLSGADILVWVEALRRETNRPGKPRSLWDIGYYVGASQRFVRHLQAKHTCHLT